MNTKKAETFTIRPGKKFPDLLSQLNALAQKKERSANYVAVRLLNSLLNPKEKKK